MEDHRFAGCWLPRLEEWVLMERPIKIRLLISILEDRSSLSLSLFYVAEFVFRDLGVKELRTCINGESNHNSCYLQKFRLYETRSILINCFNLIGFVRFLGPYYMLVVTKRRKIGAICGHTIYAITKSEMIQVPNPTARSKLAYSKDENRILYGQLPYLVYGFFKQVDLSICGRDFKFTLIARRSRHYAGTRWGVNGKGRVANDVETEQTVFENAPEGCQMKISSVVQNRGSIPLFWSHETSRMNIKPDIKYDQLSSEEAQGGNEGLSDSTPQIQTFKSPRSYCRYAPAISCKKSLR
ncbi:hypothetical protein FNV43_RR02274 [Rhamnella rubrinervis]|uniref:SAC domain-containing protein n=1 Tax=Rhamnella rubrinervis TaxID=2594499 RepID=A0A8K0HS18_9ROSA|nr:hypothetical protein FNV43_RR02274 [Rhamnella rubrinervis]